MRQDCLPLALYDKFVETDYSVLLDEILEGARLLEDPIIFTDFGTDSVNLSRQMFEEISGCMNHAL